MKNTARDEVVIVYPTGGGSPVVYPAGIEYDEIDRDGSLHLVLGDDTTDSRIHYAAWAAGSWSRFHVVTAAAAEATEARPA